jgi:hypothetical protein
VAVVTRRAAKGCTPSRSGKRVDRARNARSRAVRPQDDTERGRCHTASARVPRKRHGASRIPTLMPGTFLDIDAGRSR